MYRKLVSIVPGRKATTSHARSGQRSSRSSRRSGHFTLEQLEARQLMTASSLLDTLHATPAIKELMTVTAAGNVTPLATSGPTGYTPAQVRQAYGFSQISFNGGTIAGDGAGTTIAIVDAYDDPNIASDLHQFDLKFGLADPTFTKVNQNGGSSMPAADTGWASEISLDVEWAHAIAPKANILLVEANDSSLTNLFTAVDYARNVPGVVSVSMSWGGSEFSSESSSDYHFTTPAGHTGVTFFVSAGDSGAPAEYPSASPNVVSVGGTSLYLSGSNYSSESGWSGGGGGVSVYETQPSYQKGIVSQSTTRRATPDVAYDADPNTGVPVYDSYGTSLPWSQYGGTSAAAPQWAALTAIADQGRALAGLPALTGSQLASALYSMSSADFHDVTTGSSTGSPTLSASVGYDLVTGRGTPVANLVVGALVGSSSSTPAVATHYSIAAPSSSVAGGTFSVTVSALDATNHAVTGYTGTVHFSSTDVAAGLPADYTFTSVDGGVHTFTGLKLTTAGTQTVSAKDVLNSTVTGSASVGVTPAAANHLVFGQQPTNVNAGSAINPSVVVRVLDAYNNLVTSDSTDQVTLSLGTNPGGGSLAGTTTVTVSGGVATFSNLSVAQAGSGSTLVARSGALAGATSNAFNVASVATTGTGTVIESFDSGSLSSYHVAGSPTATVGISSSAAHDGTYGLLDSQGTDWIYRNDSAAQVHPGQAVSVWVQFATAADGRAYFGVGSSASGTLSLVAAPNTNQLILQDNSGYGFRDLAVVTQTYQANHWYKLEFDWGTGGALTGKLYDSNGTTLLQTVSATDTAISSGGIAFRAIGSNKLWDTVSVAQLATGAAVAHTTQTTTSTTQSPVIPVGFWWFDPFFGPRGMSAARASASERIAGHTAQAAATSQAISRSAGSLFADPLLIDELLLDSGTLELLATSGGRRAW